MKKLLPYILLFLLTSAKISSAAENTNGVFTIHPSRPLTTSNWIVRDVNPGKNYHETLTLENLSPETISLELTFKETSGTRDNIEIRENDDFANIGQWTSISPNQVTLSPHEKKNVDLLINIPPNVSSSEYQGAILAIHQQKKGEMNISTRIGTRIYLNVTNSEILSTNTAQPTNYSTSLLLCIISLAGLIYGFWPGQISRQTPKYE